MMAPYGEKKKKKIMMETGRDSLRCHSTLYLYSWVRASFDVVSSKENDPCEDLTMDIARS